MIKIEIKNEVNGRQYGATFSTQEEVQAWINKQESKSKCPWGEKGEYSITITDLSQDREFRNKQKIEARKKEYPKMEEVLHVLLDHGIDSPEFSELQSLRQSIKDKYPKE